LSDVNWGSLRRLQPVSRYWGFDRGTPIDRYYVERFLESHAKDIRGRTLEIGDDSYTRKIGQPGTRRDVLHYAEGNPDATIVADLTRADHIPSDLFDCIVLTQTLQLIYDVRAALQTLHRILKPAGVLLATFPGISKITEEEWPDSWFWNFTCASANRLFKEVFAEEDVLVTGFGNVLTATAFLQGIAFEELSQEEMEYKDRDYEVLITVRAMKTTTK
jgi:SAM-dependent methyltransferase